MRRRAVLAVSREARAVALDMLTHGGRAAWCAALAMVGVSTAVRVVLGGGAPE